MTIPFSGPVPHGPAAGTGPENARRLERISISLATLSGNRMIERDP